MESLIISVLSVVVIILVVSRRKHRDTANHYKSSSTEVYRLLDELKEARTYIVNLESLMRERNYAETQAYSRGMRDATAQAERAAKARYENELQHLKRIIKQYEDANRKQEWKSNDPRDYENHPNGEKNMKWNRNPQGAGKSFHGKGGDGFHTGHERRQYEKDHDPFSRQRHSQKSKQQYNRNGYDFFNEGKRNTKSYPSEIEKALKYFGITDEQAKEQLKKHYKSKARSCHPDKATGSHQKMLDCNTQYEILKKYKF